MENEGKTEDKTEKDQSELLAKLTTENELLKKERSGQDKKNTELAEELKRLSLEIKTIQEKDLSEQEKFQNALKEKEDAITLKARELAEKQRIIDRAQAVMDAKLDPELVEFLSGNSYDEYMKSANILKQKLDTKIQEGVKSTLGAVDNNKLKTGDPVTKAKLYQDSIDNYDVATALAYAKPT